jgi:hypothetical protein
MVSEVSDVPLAHHFGPVVRQNIMVGMHGEYLGVARKQRERGRGYKIPIPLPLILACPSDLPCFY